MKNKLLNSELQNLPVCAQEYITLVITKMRYHKKVRTEVMSELTAHFEDELRDCKTDEEKEQKAKKLIADFGDPKLLAILMRRAKNRCRPLWRTIVARIFQAVGILIICLILYIAWFVSGKPRVTVNYVDQLNRMVRPAADESLNAAPLYERAAKQYQKNLQDCNAIVKLQGEKFYELTPDQKQTVEKWLTDNKEILDLVITGSEKPFCWQTYPNERGGELLSLYMPQLRDYRYLAYALRWRANLYAEKGQYQKAVDDIKTSYRFGRHITADKVTYQEQLAGREIKAISVGTARDILGHNRIDSAVLAAMQNDFERLIASDDFTVDIEFEKLTVYDIAQRYFTDDRIGGGHLLTPFLLFALCAQISEPNTSSYHALPNLLHILFTHPNKQQTIEMAELCYDFFESMVQKTPAQIKAEGIDTDKQVLKIVKGNML